MNLTDAHNQLLLLGLEVLVVLGMGLAADASPGWGPVFLMVVLLLWGVFLLNHSQDLARILPGTSMPAGGGGSLVP